MFMEFAQDIVLLILSVAIVILLEQAFMYLRNHSKLKDSQWKLTLLDKFEEEIFVITKAVKKETERHFEEGGTLDSDLIEVIKKKVVEHIQTALPGLLGQVQDIIEGNIEQYIRDWVEYVLMGEQ